MFLNTKTKIVKKTQCYGNDVVNLLKLMISLNSQIVIFKKINAKKTFAAKIAFFFCYFQMQKTPNNFKIYNVFPINS